MNEHFSLINELARYQMQGLFSSTARYLDLARSVVALSKKAAMRMLGPTDHISLLHDDRYYRGRFIVREQECLLYWQKGAVFNNARDKLMPRGGYLITAHWQDHPYAYPFNGLMGINTYLGYVDPPSPNGSNGTIAISSSHMHNEENPWNL